MILRVRAEHIRMNIGSAARTGTTGSSLEKSVCIPAPLFPNHFLNGSIVNFQAIRNLFEKPQNRHLFC